MIKLILISGVVFGLYLAVKYVQENTPVYVKQFIQEIAPTAVENGFTDAESQAAKMYYNQFK